MACLLVSPKCLIPANLQTVPAALALAMGAFGCQGESTSAGVTGPGAGGTDSGAVSGTVGSTSGGSSTSGGTNSTSSVSSSNTTSAQSSTTGGDEGCPAGAVMCDGACANLSLNVYHCGSCGNACEDGQACINGTCNCQGARVDCGSGCISTDETPEHCGACNNPCPADLVCSQGSCSSGCADHLTRCGQSCTDTNGNASHCGACDNACPEGQLCKSGVCGCGSTQSLCDGACIDTDADNQNCGACNNVCQGEETCVDGFCLDESSLDCGGSPTGNTCTNFQQDVYGKYYLFNNLWGADENNVQGEQCVWNNCLAGDLIGWGTEWSWPSTSGVKSYTSVVLGWHWGWVVPQGQTGLPVRLDSSTRVECGWSFDVDSSGDFAVAYDLWTHTDQSPGNVSPTDEIMIWLYRNGAVGPIGSQQGSVNIGGAGWDVYRGQGGATWEVFTYIRQSNTTTAVLDITAFTDDLVQRNWIQSSKYLVSIEAGPEVSGGSGSVNTRGFYCRNQ